MTKIDDFQAGRFCWAELSTTDRVAACDFYSALFGWEIQNEDVPGGVYSIFTKSGSAVSAAGDQQEQERSQGVPPHWNLYVKVDDVDASAKQAEAAGGTVLAQPFDVMEYGRMAVVADPTGAVLGLWQPRSMKGYALINEPGSIEWNELMTNDVDQATSFFSEVFGWGTQTYPMPDGSTYTVFRDGKGSISGAMQNPQGMENVPPHWTAYFNVADCDATAERVKQLGGEVLFGPQFVETVGKFATCADPQSAVFALLEPDENAQQQ